MIGTGENKWHNSGAGLDRRRWEHNQPSSLLSPSSDLLLDPLWMPPVSPRRKRLGEGARERTAGGKRGGRHKERKIN